MLVVGRIKAPFIPEIKNSTGLCLKPGDALADPRHQHQQSCVGVCVLFVGWCTCCFHRFTKASVCLLARDMQHLAGMTEPPGWCTDLSNFSPEDGMHVTDREEGDEYDGDGSWFDTF